MKVMLRHLVAVSYLVPAAALVGMWCILLTPLDLAIEQLEYTLGRHNESRMSFVVAAICSVVAVGLAVAYWSPRSTRAPLNIILTLGAVFCFLMALWQLAGPAIISFGFGCGLALWLWFSPSAVLKE
jgi:hypothetical protein